MSNAMTKAAGLAAAAAASGALLVAAPAAAHASTTATHTGSVRPAVVFQCPSNYVEFHLSNGSHACFEGGFAVIYRNVNLCGVDWIDTGNNWAAWWWGLGLPTNEYEPGTPPWSVWTPGLPICVSQLAIDT